MHHLIEPSNQKLGILRQIFSIGVVFAMTYRWSEVRQLDLLSHHIDVPDSPGVYAFFNALNGAVLYVGRSDTSLRRRIQNRGYKYYAYICFNSPYEAYIFESGFYHDLKPIDNKIHPAPPRLGKFRNQVSFCPKCGVKVRRR